jgi:hypothetical protein
MSSSTHLPETESTHVEAGVDIKKVIAVGVVSLILFAISAVVAYFILRSSRREFISQHGLAPPAKYLVEPEVNIVDRIHFDSDTRLERWKGEMRKRLDGYGWVDRQQRLIHVPIEKAMQQVIEDAAKQPVSGSPGAQTPANGPAVDVSKTNTKTDATPQKPASTKPIRSAPAPAPQPAPTQEGTAP